MPDRTDDDIRREWCERFYDAEYVDVRDAFYPPAMKLKRRKGDSMEFRQWEDDPITDWNAIHAVCDERGWSLFRDPSIGITIEGDEDAADCLDTTPRAAAIACIELAKQEADA